MNITIRRTFKAISVAGILALVSACDSGSTDEELSSSLDTNAFTFPEVSDANGVVNVSIPDGPLPAFSARRKLSSGSGNTIAYGDPVVLKYSMYSWSSGELVESTDNNSEPVTVRAGVADGIPEFLAKSLLGRQVGDQLQLVFESDMEDLPDYMDVTDAYVVLLDIL